MGLYHQRWLKLPQGGPASKQDPLEAILVIFGRRALIFVYLKAPT